MKTKATLSLALLITLFASCGMPLELNSQPTQRVDIQVFYDRLSPYGQWFEYPPHGYAWRPNLGRDFVPYRSNGHWAWSEEYEWIWVSDYPWGWAPFHYGRWHFDNRLDWIWVPGYEWSPAWVVWRSNSDYYGWAPIDIGISISLSLGGYNPPSFYWNFVRGNNLHRNDLNRHFIDRNRNQDFLRRTQPLLRNNRTSEPLNPPRRRTDEGRGYEHERRATQPSFYSGGPQRAEYEQRSRTNLNPVKIRESNQPGQSQQRKDEIRLYKPQLNETPRENAKPKTIAPMEVLRRKLEGRKKD